MIAIEDTSLDPADSRIGGELRIAILEMDKAASCLRYELPGSVWDDVFKRWNTVRTLILAEVGVIDYRAGRVCG